MKRAFATALSVVLATIVIAAQTRRPSEARPLLGVYVPIVADMETAIHFYHDLLGLEPTRGSGAYADPRTRLEWWSALPFLEDMYALRGDLRNVILTIPTSELEVEPIQWREAEGRALNPRLQDPGASRLILTVRSLDTLVDRLKRGGATVLTTGGEPVAVANATGTSRAIVLEDGNGFFVELVERATLPVLGRGGPGPTSTTYPQPFISGGGLTITVADLDQSARFFREVLELSVAADPSFHADAARLELFGMQGAKYREAVIAWPDGTPQLHLIEFTGIDRRTLTPLVAEPNATLARIRVRDMDSTLARVKAFPEARIMNVSGGPMTNDGTPWLVVRVPGGSTYLQLVGPAPG